MNSNRILILIFPLIACLGCFSNVSSKMMEEINEERNELIIIENEYSSFTETVKYFVKVLLSDRASKMYQEDCLKYYGHSKDSYTQLANGMNSDRYVTLVNLKNSTNYLISIVDILLLTCEDKITEENVELASALYEELWEKAAKSEDAFLVSANELINKYKFDLNIYGAQVTKETNRKYEFWSQFVSALATGVASGLSNRYTSGSGSSTYSIMDLGGGYYSVMDMNTGQLKTCNTMGNIVNCF